MTNQITACPGCGVESSENYGDDGRCWACWNDADPERAQIRTGSLEPQTARNPDRLSVARVQTGGAFVLDVPDNVPAVWGTGDDVLWASGEPLMICGPQGVGKTTLAQQLALARAGVLEPELLGLPVAADDRPVLYIAADRPAQAARSMRRMVTDQQRAELDKRLLAWRGPLPFTIAHDPRQFADWLTSLGVGTVVIDSLKDMAVGLTDDAVGSAVNMALQETVARGIEVVDLHHQRKGQEGRKPKSLEDVYGSTWLTAGHGSVILLWGEAGDPYVSLTHLKQPASEVGPLNVQHHHGQGRSSLPEAVDLLDLAAKGVTVADAASAIYDTSSPNRNQRERARRRLDKLDEIGKVRKVSGEGSDPGVYWLACVTPRDGVRDTPHAPLTQGHDLALQAVTQGVTQGHAQSGPPFKGAVNGCVTPLRDTDEDRADRLAIEHADLNGGQAA
jgi:energy-coupling factor transporter ATP-binding protein EcfA2